MAKVQSFDEMSQSGVSQLEESHISDDCAETLNTLNSVIEDFDQSPVSDINTKLTDLQVVNQITPTNNNSATPELDNACGDCSSIIDLTKSPNHHEMEKKRKMEIIDEKAPEEPEPKKQQQQEADEPYTESSSGVEVSDSGIYDAIRSCLSDDQLLFDNISSIKDFRKSQRVKKITAQPSVIDIWPMENAKTLKNTSRLTTLKRTGDNKKREQQKEFLRDKIRQLSSALNMNTHTKLPIDQQIEARVECEKQLLFATEKYEWLQDTLRHHARSDESKSKGALEVSEILVKTNAARLIEDGLLSTSKYFLVGIISVGDHFFTTQVKQINGIGEMTTNGVALKAQQRFANLSTNFEVNISIYCFEANLLPPTKPRSTSLNSFVSSMFGRSKSRRSTMAQSTAQTPPPSSETSISIRKSGFKLLGSKKFDLKAVNRFEHAKRKITLHNGQIGECDVFTRNCHLKLTTDFESSVEYSSFLTIKLGQDKGYGAWIRYWAKLKQDQVHFWKYKEDADDCKSPERVLCLRRLLNAEVKTPRGFSMRKNSFELISSQFDGDEPVSHIGGVTLDYDTNKLIRYVLATDTPIEKQKWCSGVQTVLNELRTWDATLPEPMVDHLDDY